jgi:hypothetical protein
MPLTRPHWWLAAATVALFALPAEAIPAFARRYNASCAMCHAPAPRLNAFGELFATNGFQFSVDEAPRGAVETGDPLLRLVDRIDFALRVDGYLAGSTRTAAPAAPAVDLQLPWNVKVLSGGAITRRISYYMYFLVSERGEVAGLEDAYVQFSDLAGSGVNLMVGQFQVSDPLFKRELRLHYEDYQPYRVRVGDVRADLTYDRGLFATFSPWKGGDWALLLVSGQGLGTASAGRQYDRDLWKNVALRYSQALGPLRLGGFGYFGGERAEGQTDRIWVFGPDATLSVGRAELNLQLLRRLDSNPRLVQGGASSRVDSAMAEWVVGPLGGSERWYVAALYNWVSADDEVLSLRLGEQEVGTGFMRRYHAAALSGHYLLWRNIRLTAEAGYDLEADRLRVAAGGMLAW